MIESLFVINKTGDITLEKHWKSAINRTVCDYFFEAQKEAATPEDVPVVIVTPHHYLINIYRDQLFFVAAVKVELPPLVVVEFLHRVVDIVILYFDECSDTVIKDNLVTLYELLDEMLDNGYPLTTEPNVLQELIKPPSFFRNLSNTVTGKSNVSEILPVGQLSNIPWRRSGVRYNNNEAYFDVVEEIDAIIDKSGNLVFGEIHGFVDCCIKLSGMPDLTLSFVNPRLFDDVSFHPCVRLKRWEADRVLSFVPPDGRFRLMTFHIGSQSRVTPPIQVRHSFGFKVGESGKFDMTVSLVHFVGRTLEDVLFTISMPKYVVNCNLVPSQGRTSFESTSKTLLWEVGRLEASNTVNLRGMVRFTVNQISLSGVKVSRVDMYGEKYKPFKGVKYVTRAGRFQIRT
ncbi:AP 3 complex subunit mu 1 [Trichuris trichiura]|uniref:AP 3 complex subunit mu 1 n=1 Tax=Trichuris trichiura TaxID=36087 RepID=A0A077Z3F6_TRITR|nr:AP 3 complex subunit mu 1 [Trichuris trichiura]